MTLTPRSSSGAWAPNTNGDLSEDRILAARRRESRSASSPITATRRALRDPLLQRGGK